MKIIGLSGRKQAGKNTVANYINGDVLKNKQMISDFYIDIDGKLIIQTVDSAGQSGYGELDVTRKDKVFLEYAHKELWPYIKVYHFADPLKEMAINLFGLDPLQVYGNDDLKNKKTNLLWQNIPENIDNKTGRITNREFMEHFGTKIVRKIKYDAWSSYSMNKILNEGSELAIIPDVRFPNEVESIKSNGGIVIRLARDAFHSNSEAEKALDKDVFDWSRFDLVIDNNNITVDELCNILAKHTALWRI